MLSVARVRLEILGNIGEFTPFLAGPHTRRITHARPEAWDFFFFSGEMARERGDSAPIN